jgi:hypothetical protein
MYLLLLPILGCSGELPEEEQLAQASTTVTWDSAAALGPHRYEATVERREFSTTTEQLEVRWGDWDSFELVRRHDGRLSTRMVMIAGEAFKGTDKKLARVEDPDLVRHQVRTTWNVWSEALDPFRYAILLQHSGEGVVEGRPVETYTVTLDPTATTPPGRHQPVSLSGSIQLDGSTAVPLLARAEGVFTDTNQVERGVSVRLSRSEIGVVPDIQKKPGKSRKKDPEVVPAEP